MRNKPEPEPFLQTPNPTQVSGLQEQVRRLTPVVDWERDARGEVQTMKQQLQAASATAMLAQSERDSLLRENTKIILHYRCV